MRAPTASVPRCRHCGMMNLMSSMFDALAWKAGLAEIGNRVYHASFD
jgi:hypothetical protein